MHVVIVHPGDAAGGQRVEDRPGRRVVHQVPRQVIDQPVRGAADEEPPVGEGRPQAGAEPAVGHREGPRELVIERQLSGGPVPHGDRGIPAGHRLKHRRGEAAARAVGERDMAGVPGLRRVALELGGGLQVVRRDPLPGGQRVLGGRRPGGVHRQPVATPREHAQVVVVGVVLHHQHDDVLDLGQQVAPRGQVRPRPVPGPGHQPPPLDSPALQPFPHRNLPASTLA